MTPQRYRELHSLVQELWHKSGCPPLSNEGPDRIIDMCDKVLALNSNPVAGGRAYTLEQVKIMTNELKSFVNLIKQ